MINEKTYKKELVRMWDTLRADEYKGECSCNGVECRDCPLSVEYNDIHNSCANNINAFKIIKIVEKWSKEHQPKKYKVSQVEYDILKSFKESNLYSKFYFMSSLVTKNLLNLGYFEGADERMKICDYLNDCEVCNVVEDDTDKR